jgi:hypothetical protein
MEARFSNIQLLVEHRHNDGSWGRLQRESHHTSVDHDPERDWAKGEIYRCTSCDELVRVRREPDVEDPHH